MEKKRVAVLLITMLLLTLFCGCAQNSRPSVSELPAPSISAEPSPQTSSDGSPANGSEGPEQEPSASASETIPRVETIEAPPFQGSVSKSPGKISADIPNVKLSDERRCITDKSAYEDDTYLFFKGPAYPYYAVDIKTGKAINLASGPKIIGTNYNIYSISPEKQIIKTDVKTGKAEVLTGLKNKNIESFFIYDDKLYFTLSRDDTDKYDLYRMGLDGGGMEKLIEDARFAAACSGKVYFYNGSGTTELIEEDLATKSRRIFKLSADKFYPDAMVLNQLPYRISDKTQTGVLDTSNGSITAMFEPFYDYAAFGQYIFYTVKIKPVLFELKALDTSTGKIYYASGLDAVNLALSKYKTAVLGGFRVSQKNLYFIMFTSRLHVFRIEIKNGKCMLTEVTK